MRGPSGHSKQQRRVGELQKALEIPLGLFLRTQGVRKLVCDWWSCWSLLSSGAYLSRIAPDKHDCGNVDPLRFSPPKYLRYRSVPTVHILTMHSEERALSLGDSGVQSQASL